MNKTLIATLSLAILLRTDRKSTRLNSSHTVISYAVFCLKKKKIRVRREVSYLNPYNLLQPPRRSPRKTQPAPRQRTARPGRPRRRSRGASRGCFCNDTATPEIYTLSLHDALPI